mmetsp:Transcript_62564/g.194185  ORF Transcript_62564/g.194185 Transcript_62564/m.194185 type:complete len:102 (+) Transcript_62564:573-878(+)
MPPPRHGLATLNAALTNTPAPSTLVITRAVWSRRARCPCNAPSCAARRRTSNAAITGAQELAKEIQGTAKLEVVTAVASSHRHAWTAASSAEAVVATSTAL